MKKRFMSILLTVCMVTALFSGMTVSASADGVETVEYTLKSGDNVYKVCQRLGIDFYANYDWITSTNKITNYSSLPVGRKLILPVGDTNGIVGGTGSTGSTGTTTTTPGKVNVNLLTGDSVVSYLVPHKVSSGDTLYDICLGKGIDYNKNIDNIMRLNGLKNANRIAVGRTLLLPSTTAPAAGTACVAVVGHKIVAGDATYNLCNSYNIDYEDNLELMKALNGKSNMASIKTGQTLLIPVPTTVAAGSTGGNGGNTNNGNTNNGNTNNGNTNNGNTNNGNTNTGNTNNGNTNTGSGNTNNSTSYTITKNTTNVDRGSYTVLVNNTNSSTAVAGDTITVNATAKTGYKLDYVKATAANGSAIAMNGTTFTMPASNVTIDVYFVSSKDYRITQTYPENGSFTTVVNGSTTDDAAPGQVVNVVVAPEDGYQLEKITVLKSSTKADAGLTISNKSFVMPNYDVTVEVSFVAAPAGGSAITTEIASGNGQAAKFKINGSAVTGAKAGEVVEICPAPSDGYYLSKIEVLPNTAANAGDTITVTSNTFVMPHYPVHVKVYYMADEFDIISASSTNGSFTVTVGGKVASKAKMNETVRITPKADAGYGIQSVTYTDAQGVTQTIKADSKGGYYFTMPASYTTVAVNFRVGIYGLTAVASNNSFQVGGKTVTSAARGTEVTIVPSPAKDGYKIGTIKAVCNGEEITVKNNKFTMPAGAVKVTVEYEKVDLRITKGRVSNGDFYFTLNGNNTKVDYAKLGDIVYVTTMPAKNYHTSKITMTDAKGNTYDITGPQKFEMPGTPVTVTVTFAKNPADTGVS